MDGSRPGLRRASAALHDVAVVDGVVFLPGGLGPDRALDTFEAYDPEHDRWQALPSLPQAVHHAGVAAADGRLFVTGGYADLSFVPGVLAWAYEPSSRAWTRLPDLASRMALRSGRRTLDRAGSADSDRA